MPWTSPEYPDDAPRTTKEEQGEKEEGAEQTSNIPRKNPPKFDKNVSPEEREPASIPKREVRVSVCVCMRDAWHPSPLGVSEGREGL